jgi:hypothetical protein
MDLEALLIHYFGTTDLETLDAGQMVRGREKLALDFGVEAEPGRRFALWALLDALGDAPAPAEAFDDPALRRAADNYLSASRRLQRD